MLQIFRSDAFGTIAKSSVCAVALFFSVAPLALRGQDEEVRVCSACGSEVASDARFCQSCGTPLDGSGTTTMPEHTDSPTPKTGNPETGAEGAFDAEKAVAAVVAADAAVAKSGVSEEVRLAAIKNTLLAGAIFPDALSAEVVSSLSKLRVEIISKLCSAVRERCPVCGGRKTVPSQAGKLSPRKGTSGGRRIEDDSVEHTVPTRMETCGFCGGTGYRMRVRDRAAVMDDIRLGAASFARDAEVSGRSEAGGVWWKTADAIAYRASKRQASGSTHAAARVVTECDKCAGSGAVRCHSCHGWGRSKCQSAFHENAKRKKGTDAAPRSASRRQSTRIEDSLMQPTAMSAKCPECGSTATSPGFSRCKECEGRGLSSCRACKGSGHGR